MSERLVLACLLCSLVVAVAGADIVYTRDGRKIRGTVTRKDDTVVVETADGKTVTVKEEEVLHIAIEAPEADPEKPVKAAAAPSPAAGTKAAPKAAPAKKYTSYFVIPINGEIGKEATAALIDKSFKLVKEPDTTVVILEIDSGGGDVQEMFRIIEVLKGVRDKVRMVAFVKKNALSAAAIIGMSCDEIVMSNESAIGGAVMYRITPEGSVEVVEEKMQSIWRAKCRAILEQAGHNPLFVEGMTRADIILGIKKTEEGPQVVEGPGDKIIKPEGKILTLTGQEAVSCGLALGQAASVDECRKLLGIDRWREQSRKGHLLQRAWIKEIEQKRRRLSSLKDEAEKLNQRIEAQIRGWPRTRGKLLDSAAKLEVVLKKATFIVDAHPGIFEPGDVEWLYVLQEKSDGFREWLKSDEAKRR